MDGLLLQNGAHAGKRTGDPELEALISQPEAHCRSVGLIPVGEDNAASDEHLIARARREFRGKVERAGSGSPQSVLHLEQDSKPELLLQEISYEVVGHPRPNPRRERLGLAGVSFVEVRSDVGYHHTHVQEDDQEPVGAALPHRTRRCWIHLFPRGTVPGRSLPNLRTLR